MKKEEWFSKWLWEGMWLFLFFSTVVLVLGIIINNKSLVATTFFFIGFTSALATVKWKLKEAKKK